MTVLAPPAPATAIIDRNRLTMSVYTYSLREDERGISEIRVREHEFPITVGMAGFGTPKGEYRVVAKDRTPDWAPPKWSGVEEDVIPYKDKRNPFLAGFISLMWKLELEDGTLTAAEAKHRGLGIHAVKFDPKLEQRGRFSHGCIRVSEKTMLRIYDMFPVGSVVAIL
jgi:lipoprotein-anchoring transpeptidase ErfK/SrfK